MEEGFSFCSVLTISFTRCELLQRNLLQGCQCRE